MAAPKRKLTLEQFEHELAEEQLAIEEGRATEVVNCYLCYLEQTGKADYTGKLGPFRAVVNRGTTPGFDPYATQKLSCGHTLI